MSARIPNYKLQQVHDENPEFHVVTKVTLKDTWKLVNLTLWDEERRDASSASGISDGGRASRQQCRKGGGILPCRTASASGTLPA